MPNGNPWFRHFITRSSPASAASDTTRGTASPSLSRTIGRALSVALFAGALAPMAMAGGARHDHSGPWVAAWQGSPTPGGTFYSAGCPSDIGLSNQTIRNVLQVSAAGNWVRIRLSNAGGNEPLRVGSASVALSKGGAELDPSTVHALHFRGRTSILIAAGGEAVSDPIPLAVHAFDPLAVSVFLPSATGPASQHYFAAQDNYLASGDQSASGAPDAYTQTLSCWMFVSAVDVMAPPPVFGTLVAFGDSITDGYLSTSNANHRYTDFLARRLAARKGPTLAVVNAGIIGNELLTVRTQLAFGYPAPARFARDALAQAGARAILLLEGINDIGDRSAKAEDLIGVDLQLIQQAHAAGLRIYGGTLVPFMGSNGTYGGEYGTPKGEEERQKMNEWIRTSGAFDGVVDFDRALRDPSDPTRLLPAYDADQLHPNDAGYEAMANAVNLDAIVGEALSDTLAHRLPGGPPFEDRR